ncbi:putative origin recognition complex subunit 3-like [Capsicum annuum]|nr:putative origin recognition complex subunit 3-like [Capsicum annuum]
MSRGTDRLLKNLKQFTDLQYKQFTNRYGQQVIDILEFPIKLVLSPITLAYDIAGSAPRGFGVPEFISKLSYSTIFLVATLGTYDIAMELGKKLICQRDCRTCSGWQALQCTMCKGSGKVHYQVKSYTLKRGEKATAESIADAIADNRAELVHLPSTVDLHLPLPSKECPSCDGSGVMKCPECKGKLQIRISTDDIMEPPWKAYNIMRKMDYPYEASAMSSLFLFCCNEFLLTTIWGIFLLHLIHHCLNFYFFVDMSKDEKKDYHAVGRWEKDDKLGREKSQFLFIAYFPIAVSDHPIHQHIVDSMKDPGIAAFWLLTLPQIVGGFEYDDDVKKKIWWQYKESMRYDQLRDVVAKRKPGWEYLQDALVSIDPVRAREDPVVVKNIPYFKAKKALEAEVMKLDPPPRPQNWGELNLPLNASSWSEKDLKDPKKLYEMTVLLNAQREMAEKMLDAQWEAKWREEKLNKMLEEKVRPYIQNIDNTVLPQPIVMESERNQDQKKNYGIEEENKVDAVNLDEDDENIGETPAIGNANVRSESVNLSPRPPCAPRARKTTNIA